MSEVGGVGGVFLEERDDAVGGPGALGEVVEGEEEGEVEGVGGLEGEGEGRVVGGILGRDVEREAVDVGGLGEPDVGLPVGEGEGGEVADLGVLVSTTLTMMMDMDAQSCEQRLLLLPVQAEEPSTRPSRPRRGASLSYWEVATKVS